MNPSQALYDNQDEGEKKKIEFEANIGLHETFLEAVPTGYILTEGFI